MVIASDLEIVSETEICHGHAVQGMEADLRFVQVEVRVGGSRALVNGNSELGILELGRDCGVSPFELDRSGWRGLIRELYGYLAIVARHPTDESFVGRKIGRRRNDR